MKKKMRKALRQYADAFWFVTPGLILVSLFILYPMLFTLRIALSDYKIVKNEITFTGLNNFAQVFAGGSRFWFAVRNNFLYAVVTVPLIILGGMFFAYLIIEIDLYLLLNCSYSIE